MPMWHEVDFSHLDVKEDIPAKNMCAEKRGYPLWHPDYTEVAHLGYENIKF